MEVPYIFPSLYIYTGKPFCYLMHRAERMMTKESLSVEGKDSKSDPDGTRLTRFGLSLAFAVLPKSHATHISLA